MTARVLPASDAYATCPMEGNVLAYYRGVFDSVFVLFHPFIQPIGLSADLFKPDTYPRRHEISALCTAVPWSEIQRISGLNSAAEVDIALRTQIGGLKKELASERLVRSLESALDASGVLPPSEGEFSDLLHDKVLSFIQEQGYEWVWVGDELCTERKLYWIEDLKKPESLVTQGHCNVFTPDKRILWTTHWDSHFSFICSSADVIASVEGESGFEGFTCTSATQVYWSVHDD